MPLFKNNVSVNAPNVPMNRLKGNHLDQSLMKSA
jgi:hypothetical protein